MSVNDDRISEAMRILREMGQTVVGGAKRVNNNGDQIRTRSGAVVNLWDKGTVSFQGNMPQKLQDALVHLDLRNADESPAVARTVFVVYGHDARARE